MENYWEAGKLFGNLFKNVKAKLGLLTGLELVCAVAGADCDCERVNAGAGYEIVNLIRVGEAGLVLGNINIVLNSGKLTKLTLNNNAVGVSIINNLFGQGNVLLIGKMGAVNHY